MTATHIAAVYEGTITLTSVKPDPSNANMVFGLVVRDRRGFSHPSFLHTGRRVWIAAKQVAPVQS